MQILKKEAKRITVLTANGTELVCKPVRKLPVRDLLFKLGLSAETMQATTEQGISDAMEKFSAAQQIKTTKASMALFNYCMAYGVENNPPEEAVEELNALGLAPGTPTALRATWLNYMVLEDAEEAGLLSAVIMALTFRGDGTELEVPGIEPATE